MLAVRRGQPDSVIYRFGLKMGQGGASSLVEEGLERHVAHSCASICEFWGIPRQNGHPAKPLRARFVRAPSTYLSHSARAARAVWTATVDVTGVRS